MQVSLHLRAFCSAPLLFPALITESRRVLARVSIGISPFSQTWESLNQQVADKIKDIVVFDINPSNPFTNSELEGMKFDTITTSLCLQAAALTMEEFKGVLQNIRYDHLNFD